MRNRILYILFAIMISIPGILFAATPDENLPVENPALENPAVEEPAIENPPVETTPVATPVATPPAKIPAKVSPAEPATDMPLELLFFQDVEISTVTKYKKKLSEVPGNVSVITGEELRKKGALTLADIILDITGTYLDYSSILPTVRVHGIADNQNANVLLLINGRKVNIPEWGQVDIDFGINNLDNVKRIEIIKGPGAALYGANAFSGIINIITNEGKDIKGVQIRAGAGSLNRAQDASQYYNVTYGDQSGDWDYLVDASYWMQFGSMQPNNGEGRPYNYYEGERAAASLKYGDQWSLEGGFNKERQPVSSLGFHGITDGYLMAKYNYTLDDLSKLSLILNDTLYNKFYPAMTFGKNKRISSKADVPEDATIVADMFGNVTPVPDDIEGFYLSQAEYFDPATTYTWSVDPNGGGPMNEFNGEVQYDLAWPENNYLIAGLSYRYDRVEYHSITEPIVSDNNYSFYLQDEYHLLSNLILFAGGRLDYNSSYGQMVNPKANLNYYLLPELVVKLSYGTAFREPSLYERYCYWSTDRDELEPETLEQEEIDLEYTLGTIWQTKAAYYYANTDNEFATQMVECPLYIYSPNLSMLGFGLPAQPGLYLAPFTTYDYAWINQGKHIYRGLEWENTIRPMDFVYLKLNYARPTTYLVDSPNPIQDINLVNCTVGVNYLDMVFVNFYSHSIRMCRPIGDVVNGYSNEYTWIKRYDASIGGKYENWGLTLSVTNLLDDFAYYYSTTNIYREHRNWRAFVDYTFQF